MSAGFVHLLLRTSSVRNASNLCRYKCECCLKMNGKTLVRSQSLVESCMNSAAGLTVISFQFVAWYFNIFIFTDGDNDFRIRVG